MIKTAGETQKRSRNGAERRDPEGKILGK